MGQLVEIVKAHALLNTETCWDCKLWLHSSFWEGCVIWVQNCTLNPLSWPHLSVFLLFNKTFLSLASFLILLNLTFCPEFACCSPWANVGLKLSHLSFSPHFAVVVLFLFFFLSDLLYRCSSSSCLSNLPNCLWSSLFYASLICELSVLN